MSALRLAALWIVWMEADVEPLLFSPQCDILLFANAVICVAKPGGHRRVGVARSIKV